jgi:hypothetical protein
VNTKKSRPAANGAAQEVIAATTTSVPPRRVPVQAAEWYPPHRGRAGWLLIVQLCIHCLGGHRHVVDGALKKTLAKSCPVT